MSTAELKIDLINKITGINDKVRLKAILQMLKFESDESVYVTNQEEREAVEEARSQIARGEFLSNDAVQKEIKEWLKK